MQESSDKEKLIGVTLQYLNCKPPQVFGVPPLYWAKFDILDSRDYGRFETVQEVGFVGKQLHEGRVHLSVILVQMELVD